MVTFRQGFLKSFDNILQRYDHLIPMNEEAIKKGMELIREV